jgi:hypothetical protein
MPAITREVRNGPQGSPDLHTCERNCRRVAFGDQRGCRNESWLHSESAKKKKKKKKCKKKKK